MPPPSSALPLGGLAVALVAGGLGLRQLQRRKPAPISSVRPLAPRAPQPRRQAHPSQEPFPSPSASSDNPVDSPVDSPVGGAVGESNGLSIHRSAEANAGANAGAATECGEELQALARDLVRPGARLAILGAPGSGRRHRARAVAAATAALETPPASVVVLDASRGFTDLALQLLSWQQSLPTPPALVEGETLRELVRLGGNRGDLLLVLHNLPCDAEGQALERWLAGALGQGCRRLVTQKNASERAGACLELEGLPEPVALSLVCGPHRLSGHQDPACRALLHRLAALPLPLTWLARAAQAGQPLDWSAWLARHQSLESDALAGLPSRSPLAESPGIAALLLLLWQRLPEPARQLGLLLGAMAAAPIPTELLDLCAALEPAFTPEAGLPPLERAGLLTIQAETPARGAVVEIHPLVHAFLRQQRRLGGPVEPMARITLLRALGHLAHGRIPAGLTVLERLPLAPLLPHLREAVNRERRQQPEAELLWPVLAIGRLLEGLEGDEDSRLLEACLEICESQLGPDHPDTAVALLNLAALYDNTANGDPRAEALLRRALAVRSHSFGEEDPSTAAIQARLGVVLAGRGEREQAISLLEQALAVREDRQGPHHPDLLGPLTRLMALQEAHGAHARAERLGRRILEIQEQALGPDDPGRAATLQRLGQLQELQGHPERATSFYSRALEELQRQLGAHDPALAPLLGQLGSLALARGEEQLAEHHVRQALALLPAGQPEAARWLQDLARLHQGRGELAEAERLSRQALALRERSLGAWHPETANALNALAWLLSERQEPDEALVLCRRALAIRRRSLGSHHLETASSLNTLAALHEQADDPEEALLLYQEALEITETQLGPDHPGTRTVRANLRNCSARLEQQRQVS